MSDQDTGSHPTKHPMKGVMCTCASGCNHCQCWCHTSPVEPRGASSTAEPLPSKQAIGVRLPGAAHSYHDLHITTVTIPRTSIFNLPYGLEVICNRTAGWQLINQDDPNNWFVAGEYHDSDENWLILDVGGYVILDSRDAPQGE